jgi:hypothetical protein
MVSDRIVASRLPGRGLSGERVGCQRAGASPRGVPGLIEFPEADLERPRAPSNRVGRRPRRGASTPPGRVSRPVRGLAPCISEPSQDARKPATWFLVVTVAHGHRGFRADPGGLSTCWGHDVLFAWRRADAPRPGRCRRPHRKRRARRGESGRGTSPRLSWPPRSGGYC